MDESSPLQANDQTDVYDRFSRARKRAILLLASCSGLLPLFVSGSFVPCIPQIADDLHTSGSIINLAVSVSLLTVAVSSLFWATYSGFYGRRPIYLASLPFLCFGSLGVGLSHSVTSLIFFRTVQGFGAASGLSVGPAVVADIYKMDERGAAMGVFFSAILLGPALAPVTGGIAAHYYTWRHMQYAFVVAGFVVFMLMLLFMPETTRPGTRGVDKSENLPPNWVGFVWLNPFRCLSLFKSPILVIVTIARTFVLLTDYVLLIPLAYTIGERYNIKNEAILGACFIPAGLGNIIGAPIAGHISDLTVIKWRKRRNGEWVPEDRLRATLLSAGVLIPLSILISGFTIRFVPGVTGIVISLVCLFMNGIGVDSTLSPSTAYLIDILHTQSAETMAATQGVRGIFLALISLGIIPSVTTLGPLVTDTASAILAWISFLLLLLTIRYGPRLRAWVDIGYTTIPS